MRRFLASLILLLSILPHPALASTERSLVLRADESGPVAYVVPAGRRLICKGVWAAARSGSPAAPLGAVSINASGVSNHPLEVDGTVTLAYLFLSGATNTPSVSALQFPGPGLVLNAGGQLDVSVTPGQTAVFRVMFFCTEEID